MTSHYFLENVHVDVEEICREKNHVFASNVKGRKGFQGDNDNNNIINMYIYNYLFSLNKINFPCLQRKHYKRMQFALSHV